VRGRGKSLVVFATILALLVGTIAFVNVAFAAPNDFVLAPSSVSWSEPTNHINDLFTITFKVTTATDLWMWQTGLKWNPSILEVTAVSYATGPTSFYTLSGGAPLSVPANPMTAVDNVIGEFSTAVSQASTINAVTASEVICMIVTFKAKNYAYPTPSPIQIKQSASAPWFTKGQTKVGATITDFVPALYPSSFLFAPSANVAPVAAFTYSPAVPVAGVDTVTFDASSSYDPDGLGIKNMTINFGEGSPQTKTSAPWTFSHLYASPATYTVTLLVWDVGKPPYYPELSDTEIKTVKVIPPALPSDVDVFTIKTWLGRTTLYRERGTGSDAPGSAFAPGETVTLRGYAYYAEEAQEGVPVTFEVRRPDTSVMVSLVAPTNAAGNATVTFKLPMGTAHGTYTVTASCMIFGESFFDTLDMPVGDIIVINSVTPSAATVARGSSISFSVSVTNIDLYDAYPVLLSVSVKDKIGQSLGAVSSDLMVAPGTSTYSLSFPVPTFAVKGYPATAEANALTNWPSLGGVAYCSPKTASFEIV